MPKTIKMLIPRRGLATGESSIEIETTGFAGASCQDAAKAFLDAMGAAGVDEELTDEYFMEEPEEEQLFEGGN